MSCAITLAVLTVVAGASFGQDSSLNRVADGNFENGFISLSLPAVEQFPMFSGGWASRGQRIPDVVPGASYAGLRSLRIATRPRDALQVLQDLPLNSPAFELRVAFLIEGGNQTVRLLNDWDRGEPEAGAVAFEARISPDEIAFKTPSGSWQIDTDLAELEWHTLRIVADSRLGTQSVRLDGNLLVTLPGVSARRPTTLVLGGGTNDLGTFRYDAVSVTSLVDAELAELREAAALDLSAETRDAFTDRLEAAEAGLDRNSPLLALSELAVARRILGVAGRAEEEIGAALGKLIELIDAAREDAGRRGRIQF